MIASTQNLKTEKNKFIQPLAVTRRITSIDLLRGIVMIIMALDHTRDYFNADAFLFDPTDLSKTNEWLFLTRWITHFCAPVFMFLSGTSAFFVGRRKNKNELAKFLLTRGLWLILLELTVVNFGWYFDLSFSNIDFNVIWALGAGMIVLAGLIYLPFIGIIIIGAILIGAHNLLDGVQVTGNTIQAFGWSLLHQTGEFKFFGRIFFVGYPILSWVGVMALGYCLGKLYNPFIEAVRRKKILIILGSAIIILFILLRAINIYGDPRPWSYHASAAFTFLSFINVFKYPPSLLYILITLGPAILFLAFAEKPLNRLSKMVSVFGRVPMFYYILHLYLIHALAEIAAYFTGFKWSDKTIWMNANPELKGYGFSLGTTYLVWICIVILLYPLCKWYDRYKTAHKEKWWLSYL
ncbi:MAG: heparan-alpha-glucosaminide N-acetyltransferase domain-containing protein [Chitinophagaceae bacterium]